MAAIIATALWVGAVVMVYLRGRHGWAITMLIIAAVVWADTASDEDER